MKLVPYEKLEQVETLLEMCRENYDLNLTYGWKRLKEMFLDMGLAKLAQKSDLVVGKSYGYIGYSAGATAIRNGKQLRNHGEIYIYQYKWNGTDFVAENALGGICFLAALPDPVIELS